ncbi:MAG: hypothetical protein EOO14_15970, partial [Chitinophagaceae bacterium]
MYVESSLKTTRILDIGYSIFAISYCDSVKAGLNTYNFFAALAHRLLLIVHCQLAHFPIFSGFKPQQIFMNSHRMKKTVFIALTILFTQAGFAQNLAPLTVEKIMRDPKWIGSSPANIYWAADGRTLFFNWNPTGAEADSLYYITLTDRTPKKASLEMRRNAVSQNSIVYNKAKNGYAYTKEGDLFYVDAKTGRERRITQTTESEFSPQFIENDTRIVYNRSQNLYAWEIATGLTTQLTNFQRGNAQREATQNTQEKWL